MSRVRYDGVIATGSSVGVGGELTLPIALAHGTPQAEVSVAEDPNQGGDTSGSWGGLAGGLALAALVAALVLWRLGRLARSRSDDAAPDAAQTNVAPYTEASYAAAVRAISAHQEAWLAYGLRLEGMRRSYTISELTALLGRSASEVTRPVLRLDSPDGFWSAGELNLIVDRVLDELALYDVPEESDPRRRASMACELVAEMKAKELCDEFERGRNTTPDAPMG